MTKNSSVVTGASGIVGRALLKKILGQGRPVIALSRRPPLLPDLDPAQAKLLTWHAADVALPKLGLAPEIYAAVCNQARTIFHLAARTDFKDATATSYLDVNVEGVRHALDLARESEAPLHHVSTAFVCGTWQGAFREEDLDLGQSFRNGYEESKFLGERFLREQIAAQAYPVTIHRPGIVVERNPTAASGKTFGPFLFLDGVARIRSLGDKQGDSPALRVLGNNKAHLPLIFDYAVAEALWQAAQKPQAAGRNFHLVAPEPVSNSVLEEAFNQAFGGPVARFAAQDEFARNAPSKAEAILAKKTAPYAPYLDLQVRFARQGLDSLLGQTILPTPDKDSLVAVFQRFLAARAPRASETDQS